MLYLSRKLSAASAILLLAVVAARAADKADVLTPFNGKNLDGWKLQGSPAQSKWTVGIAKLDPANPRELVVEPASEQNGEMVNAKAGGVDIYTEQKFGDATIEVEVMVPKGSNSGIYLMGEYELQILDSYGKQRVGPGDMGGLYSISAPKVNASKKPGEWQKFVFEFQAPRFDGDKKTANARLIKATLNDQVIYENLEFPHQTPGGLTGREAPTGPLMFQGNHGPVAFRAIKITPAAPKP